MPVQPPRLYLRSWCKKAMQPPGCIYEVGVERLCSHPVVSTKLVEKGYAATRLYAATFMYSHSTMHIQFAIRVDILQIRTDILASYLNDLSQRLDFGGPLGPFRGSFGPRRLFWRAPGQKCSFSNRKIVFFFSQNSLPCLGKSDNS